jgi:NAD(P)-dependent dehydrogenase (short-subunit alcohol dehydrogenase family)
MQEERTSTNSQSALITGAGSGIGLATALALHDDGWTVYPTVRKAEDVERLQALRPGWEPLWLDVTDKATITGAVARVRQRQGSLGVLVNNAGYSMACPLEFTPLDMLRHQFEVNVIGQLAVCQAFIPLLRSHGGRIINITSLSAYISGPIVGPYAASKHAFASLSESLRLELRRHNIRVIQVIPGDIQTPIWTKSRTAADSLRDSIAQEILESLPDSVQQEYISDSQAMRSATARFAERALPVERVVAAVQHAATSKYPRSHYIIGGRAWGAVRVLRMLPGLLRDQVILRSLGMKR